MRALCLALLIVVGVSAAAQNSPVIGGFTASSAEHTILQVDHPFVVRSINGIVRMETTIPPEPKADVLFEIRGPGDDPNIRQVRTDKSGHFKIGRFPKGTYKFKASLIGFASVVGTVTLSSEAPKGRKVEINMQPDN